MTEAIKKDFPKYTKIVKEAMEGLTLRELGLYAHMKSQKEDWKFNIGYMARQLGCSVYQVRTNIRNLISKGLIERIQTRIKGFIGYIYKLRDQRGEVRDDVNLMNNLKNLKEDVSIAVKKEIVVEKEVLAVEKEILEVVTEQKNWRDLFVGNEKYIDAFIADRKKHLSDCDHYKKNLGRAATNVDAEAHISRKLNEKNSDMEARIKEFIASEINKEKIKIKKELEQEIPEAKKVEIERKDKILQAKANLSKIKFPELWANFKVGDFAWITEKKRLEATIKSELDQIEQEINKEYETLIGVALK